MLIAAAAISINLSLASVLRRTSEAIPAKQECHVRVVSHKFVGTPGTEFKYDGEGYVIPRSGSIELIASKHGDTFTVGGRQLPLNVFPLDQFGTETVNVPEASAAIAPAPESPASSASDAAAAGATASALRP